MWTSFAFGNNKPNTIGCQEHLALLRYAGMGTKAHLAVSAEAAQEVKMRTSREHAGPRDPLQRLVEAGADRDELCMRLAFVKTAAELETYFKNERSGPNRKRRMKRRRAEQALLTRFPGRVRDFGKSIAKYLSEPEFDPRRLLPRPEKRATLTERIEQISENQVAIPALVSEWLKLPRILMGFAKYFEMCLASRKSGQTQPNRSDWLLRREALMLADYVRQATGEPHYPEVADLVNRQFHGACSHRVVTAEDLRKLSDRNPNLRLPPAKPF